MLKPEKLALSFSRQIPSLKPKPRRDLVGDFLLRLKKCVSMNQLREIQAQMLLSSVENPNFLIPRAVKLGDFAHASLLFSATEQPNHYSFNSMISGLTNTWRDHRAALSMYRRMRLSWLRPDRFTYNFVFVTCGNLKEIRVGRSFHSSLFKAGFERDDHVIDHYTNVIDLLARAGMLNEAWEFVEKFPRKPDEVMLGAVLGACQKRKDVVIGGKAMKMLMEMEEARNAGNYVISSKVYADMKMWDESAKVRALMRDRGVVKTPGCSWIEMDGEMVEFNAGSDVLQCSGEDATSLLGLLVEEMKKERYNFAVGV